MPQKSVSIRNSIATRLMSIVFSFYVVIAVLITLTHMYVEYNYQKADVNKSLVEFEPSIQSTLSMNIWHMDDLALSETMDSILKIPVIVGMTVADDSGTVIAAEGIVSDNEKSGLIEQTINFLGIQKNGNLHVETEVYSLEVFRHEFPIFYSHGGEKRALGKVALYSSSAVILQRVKLQFMMLVFNAIIKTIALWICFLYISNKLLRKPLSELAGAVEQVDINNISDTNITISNRKDELRVIEQSFNRMLKKLSDSLFLQKEAQSQVIEQKSQFETLVDNIPGVTYRNEYKKDWGVVYISDEIYKLSGYQGSDFTSKKRTYHSIIFIEDSAMVERSIADAVANKSGFNIQYRIVKADGVNCWVNERGQCILDADSNVIYIDGVIIDINDQKQAEFEVRKLKKYLANVIDSMPSALVGIDSDMKVTQWNKTIADTTGIDEKQALGKDFHALLPHFESEIAKIRESIQTRTILAHQSRVKVDGEQKKYEDVTIYPLIANGVQGAVIRIDDVTEKVQVEEILVQSEKMLSVGGLAAGMAHEINNPLAGMLQTMHVMSNRLIEKPDMPANVQAANEVGTSTEVITEYMRKRDIPRMINTILCAGNRAAAIITNMLSFARKGGSDKIPIDAGELINSTVELALTDYNVKGNYDFKKIDIKIELPEEPVNIFCDKSQIQQVFLNLLRNAAQAMHEAKIPSQFISLKVYYDTNSEMVVTEVEDNGPGMDSETVKRVFEPFFTTKSVGYGTGLGLSVSYFIITENHLGDMYVNSELGKGTKFTIKLPSKPGKGMLAGY